MFIVDSDIIEGSNLSRSVLFRKEDVKTGFSKARIAATRAKDLNPDKHAVCNYLSADVVWDIGLGVYRHSDVIIGCLDNIEARLSVNLNCWKTGKTWVDGGLWGLAGSVSVYNSKLENACYECGMTQDHYRMAKTRYSCTNAVIKAKNKQNYMPATQTTSAIIGAIQSQEAIKILHNIPSFWGNRLMFNGLSHSYLEGNTPIYLIDLSVNSECICHQEQKIEGIIELSEASNEINLADFFDLLHKKVGVGKIKIDLACEFIVNSICPFCERITNINRPKHKLRDVDIVCPKCEVGCPTCGSQNLGTPDCCFCGQEDIYEPRLETFNQILEDSDIFLTYKEYKLRDFGVPILQILKITLEQKQYFVELTGDISNIWN